VYFEGLSFTLGPANAPDVVTRTTIPLPAVNGNQVSQTFMVNYSDGSSTTFVQSLSDWYTPKNYTGESQATTIAYRDTSNGAEDNRTFYLYEYSFALNNAKTASSFTLPNGNVLALGISLAP
jgi:hypothetical protein